MKIHFRKKISVSKNAFKLTHCLCVLDRKYVLKKCPALINEMINIISQLVASAMARQSMYIKSSYNSTVSLVDWHGGMVGTLDLLSKDHWSGISSDP